MILYQVVRANDAFAPRYGITSFRVHRSLEAAWDEAGSKLEDIFLEHCVGAFHISKVVINPKARNIVVHLDDEHPLSRSRTEVLHIQLLMLDD